MSRRLGEKTNESPKEPENFGLAPFKQAKVLLPVTGCYRVLHNEGFKKG
jgi:hypothetical protein